MVSRIATYGAFKRGVDLVLALTMLVVFLPLLLIVAVIIKLDSPGPVLFRQKRTGKNGKEFEILKFRSMVADNDAMDSTRENQYTRFGRIIRRTSIDELPQLINIVKGEMAFIGPRPWVPAYYKNMNKRERGRVAVRPGITGLAAAKGRNDLTVFEKINYDLEYINHYSLRMDMKVIYYTAKTVLSREGAEGGKAQLHSDIQDLMAENNFLRNM